MITDVHAHVIVPELTAGAGNVLLGSDRPFDMGTDDPVGEVRALGLDPEAERAILGGNAARLLGLDADRAASAEGART